MILLDVADLIADVLKCESVYAGTADANLKQCIGVYNAKNSRSHKICLGGSDCTRVHEKSISILIHWTDNPTEAEKQSQKVFDSLSSVSAYSASDFLINYISCKDPIPVGRDDRGIYEYVIEAIIYYERKKENE